MEGKKVSVIIPIYNTVDYLEKCLRSVQEQTYANLEIICIDDGSFDGSAEIADDFAEKDKRFVVIHQPNGGESNARNTGLKMATGEYIAFVDCDDWIETDMYQTLVEKMEEKTVSVVASGWYKDSEEGSEQITNSLPVKQGVLYRDELLQYLYMRDSYRGFAYMWNKLYKRECITGLDGKLILFDENLKLGGDVLWLAKVALRVTGAKYIEKAFYHYNQRAISGSHTRDVRKLRDWIKAYELVIEAFEQESVDRLITDYVKRFLAYHSSNAAEVSYARQDKEALSVFKEFMKKYEKEYVSLNREWPERICRYREIMACEI